MTFRRSQPNPSCSFNAEKKEEGKNYFLDPQRHKHHNEKMNYVTPVLFSNKILFFYFSSPRF